MDTSSAPTELQVSKFIGYFSKATSVIDEISELYNKTDADTLSDEALRSAFYSAQISKNLSEVNSLFSSHMDAYQAVCDETGDINLILSPAAAYAKYIRETVNNLFDLYEKLATIEKAHVSHYVRIVRTRNDDLRQKLNEYSPNH